jgi:hypothetical protein
VSERPVPGTEGPRGHELRPPVDDRKVPWRVFVSIGVFVAVIAAIYAGTAYEGAGTVMLIVASVLALWVGSFLWLKEREQEAAGEGGHEPEALASSDAHYLPHASAWPFAIGLGAATLANGLVLGLWVIVPGVTLMAIGIGGFVRQTRRRD